ncbi:antibiotic biosynthesis monooxygenase [Haliangium ochraceum]|nr:antibiotic biosynthesis monooxygenase [Haliangium ochraceum]
MTALGLVLSACTTVTAPFAAGPAEGESTPSGRYIVAVTHLRYSESATDAFNRHAEVLQKLASASPGNVGTSFRGDLGGRDRWTLSVWTDAARMGAFVASPEHIAAIREIVPAAEIVRTVQYRIELDEYPPAWDDALHVLETQGIDR